MIFTIVVTVLATITGGSILSWLLTMVVKLNMQKALKSEEDTCSILILDEDSIRRICVEHLERKGYLVTGAKVFDNEVIACLRQLERRDG